MVTGGICDRISINIKGHTGPDMNTHNIKELEAAVRAAKEQVAWAKSQQGIQPTLYQDGLALAALGEARRTQRKAVAKLAAARRGK